MQQCHQWLMISFDLKFLAKYVSCEFLTCPCGCQGLLLDLCILSFNLSHRP